MRAEPGGIGCNILLSEIPSDGKITMISSGVPLNKEQVRSEFSRVKDLSKVPPSSRGWTLDVLSVIRRLGKQDFSLKEVYEFESELRELHPRNQNIRPKIRQQLQVLRDLSMIKFAGEGRYLLPS
ncbi:MAG: DpnI domain-containing protein [Candidatus Sulfotelmatobacter sp.]|jgi:type II restriction enzyme